MDFTKKNTMAFLNNYTDRVVNTTKSEILRNRKRNYSTRSLVAPIESSGSGRESVSKVVKTDGFDVIGNDYLEDVDEGTRSTTDTLSEILNWMTTKPVIIRDRKGNALAQTSERKNAVAKIIVDKLRDKGIRRTAFLTDLVDNSIKYLNGIGDAVVDDIVDNIDNILEEYGFVKKGEKYVIEIKK